MAKEKKKKTPTQKKRQYRAIQYTCFFSEFISVFTPFITIGLVNYNKYFVQYNGTKMSIAAIMAMALMGIATWLVAKQKFNNSFITLIVGWATLTISFLLMGELIQDLAYIMLFGLIGILGAYGLDIGSKAAKKKADEIQQGINQAKLESTAEDYKEEVAAKKKIKIKIVKKDDKE